MSKLRKKAFLILIFFLMVLDSHVFSFDKKVTVAVIKSRDIAPYNTSLEGFTKVLKEKGFDAEFLKYDMKGNKDEGHRIAGEVKAGKPDIVLTIGSLSTEIAQQDIKDLPLVFCMILNPVASGLVSSMESPGNNLTGASMDIPIRQQFENLKLIFPNMKRIGVVYNPRETGVVVEQASTVAKGMGFELVCREVNSEKEIPQAIEDLGKSIDVLWSVADSTVFTPQSTQYIILYSLRNKLPFMGLSASYVKAGALLALSSDERDIGRQAGETAAEILSGKKPEELPVTVPQKILLSLNMRVADQIGVKIPSDMVNRAKEVFR